MKNKKELSIEIMNELEKFLIKHQRIYFPVYALFQNVVSKYTNLLTSAQMLLPYRKFSLKYIFNIGFKKRTKDLFDAGIYLFVNIKFSVMKTLILPLQLIYNYSSDL